MLRSFRLAATCILAIILSACNHVPTMSSSASSLTGTLTKQLGVTEAQAQGGIGSLLELSKSNLGSAQFDQLAKSIPGADKYLQQAPNLGAPITDMNGVNSAFSKLGMSPDMVNKFKPTILDYAGKYGGDTTKNLLAGALK